MTTEILTPPTTRTAPVDADAPSTDRLLGMTCRNCGLTKPIALAYVCPACFGPLEVSYDLAFQAGRLAYGLPILASAIAVVYLLFTPPVRAVLEVGD